MIRRWLCFSEVVRIGLRARGIDFDAELVDARSLAGQRSHRRIRFAGHQVAFSRRGLGALQGIGTGGIVVAVDLTNAVAVCKRRQRERADGEIAFDLDGHAGAR